MAGRASVRSRQPAGAGAAGRGCGMMLVSASHTASTSTAASAARVCVEEAASSSGLLNPPQTTLATSSCSDAHHSQGKRQDQCSVMVVAKMADALRDCEGEPVTVRFKDARQLRRLVLVRKPILSASHALAQNFSPIAAEVQSMNRSPPVHQCDV